MIWLWFACAEHVESVEYTVQGPQRFKKALRPIVF